MSARCRCSTPAATRAHSAAARCAGTGSSGNGRTVCRPSARRDRHPALLALGGQGGRGGRQSRRPQPLQSPGDQRRTQQRGRPSGDRLVGGGCGIAGERDSGSQPAIEPGGHRPLSSTRCRAHDGVPLPGEQQQLAGRSERLQLLVRLHRLRDRHVGVPVAVRQQDRRGQPRDPVIGESAASISRSATGSPYSVTEAAAIHGSVPAKKVRRSLMPASVTPAANRSGHRVSATRSGSRRRTSRAPDAAGFGDAGGDERVHRRPDVVEGRLPGGTVVGGRERAP